MHYASTSRIPTEQLEKMKGGVNEKQTKHFTQLYYNIIFCVCQHTQLKKTKIIFRKVPLHKIRL